METSDGIEDEPDVGAQLQALSKKLDKALEHNEMDQEVVQQMSDISEQLDELLPALTELREGIGIVIKNWERGHRIRAFMERRRKRIREEGE